ncbi:MAG: calcium/sodium antiporter [Cyclobacteriaceae bacterium]|nr:calcium/sodium antiporter [Cyclobacteriaceae bacterium]
MFLNVILLIVGLFVLILGGDFLVRGASNIALRLHISPLVVGLTIVAFGTSAPELLISIKSALSGSPDLAMGNVVGSNICNLALVLGITCVLEPIKVQSDSMKIDWPVAMGSAIILYFVAKEGYINRIEGIIFFSLLIAYTFFIIRRSRKETKAMRELEEDLDLPDNPSNNVWKDMVFLMIGALGLYYGSEWFVGGAKDLARELGVSERVIGITVLALGTSLPELVTAIVASLKKETDLALGNLMGSNIFNILSILGITSIITEIKVSPEILTHDMIPMLGITLLILPMMITGRTIGRFEGMILLLIYFVYTYTVVF